MSLTSLFLTFNWFDIISGISSVDLELVSDGWVYILLPISISEKITLDLLMLFVDLLIGCFLWLSMDLLIHPDVKANDNFNN